MRKIFATIFYAAIFVSGCVSSKTQSAAQLEGGVVTVNEFEKFSSSLDGKKITLGGYLVPYYPDLALIEKKSDVFSDSVPTVFVGDVTLRMEAYDNDLSGEAGLLEAQGCVEQYVRLTGIVGQTVFGVPGIVKIIEIKRFPDELLGGDGEVCFSAS